MLAWVRVSDLGASIRRQWARFDCSREDLDLLYQAVTSWREEIVDADYSPGAAANRRRAYERMAKRIGAARRLLG